MSNHSSYSRGPTRQFYPSPTSLSSTDPGYGSTRDMGPPPMDFPPQPVEIDLNNTLLSHSRTLPNPSSFVGWDSTIFPSHTSADIPSTYGSINKMPQIPLDSQIRTSAQVPLLQWYQDNDGPWYPKTISDVPEERTHTRGQTGNRASVPFGGQYRHQKPSDNGTFHFGVPQSDSGYGTMRSVGNASIFSADVTDRDQDCQSLTGHIADFQPFQGMNDALQSRDARSTEAWPLPLPVTPPENPNLFCTVCQKSVKTKSELKKHDLRHQKPFKCSYPGCTRTEGFSTTNDLERHTKSKHPSAIPASESTKKYRCHVPGCKSKDKSWPRLDNFRSHLKRVHASYFPHEEDFEPMIRRAEYWERPGPSKEQDSSSPRSSVQDPLQARPVFRETPPSHQESGNNWRTGYPDLIQDLVAPNLEDSRATEAIPDPKFLSSEPQSRNTVKPLEVFQGPVEILNRIPLERVLLTPVGTKNTILKKTESGNRQPPSGPQSSPQGKTVRHVVSATDATITEVIRSALANSPEGSIGSPLERNPLPSGKSSPRRPWDSQSNSAVSPQSDLADDSVRSKEQEQEQEQKAIEVLKTLQRLGYIVSKDPSHSQRTQNLGSAASHRSENQVTCQQCQKFTGRPCELKKHMKRHERPYGCTFRSCNKVFGSKNDWKRHENSQHYHLETWRCDEEKPEGGPCAKASYRRQTFQEHLKKEHQILNPDAIKLKLDNCRIGRNCQERFWCGFCTKLIELKKKGLDAWTERFDHIDDHFMGRRNNIKQGIQEWIPVDGDKPIGDSTGPHSLDGTSSKESQENTPGSDAASASNRDSPQSSQSTGESPADAIVISHHDGSPSKKRAATGEIGDNRGAKHARVTETLVYCCKCTDEPGQNVMVNPSCMKCSHQYCSNCDQDQSHIDEDSTCEEA